MSCLKSVALSDLSMSITQSIKIKHLAPCVFPFAFARFLGLIVTRLLSDRSGYNDEDSRDGRGALC